MQEEANREAMRAAAAIMGSSRSEAKAKAARENGRLGGGSPRLFAPCASGKPHRWRNGRCRFCGQAKTALRLKD